MNPNDNTDYNPAEDENQGVITKLVQGESQGGGVAQADYMNPVTNQGPEVEKDEVNDHDDRYAGAGPLDTNATGINDDLLAEEDVENGDVAVYDDES